MFEGRAACCWLPHALTEAGALCVEPSSHTARFPYRLDTGTQVGVRSSAF